MRIGVRNLYPHSLCNSGRVMSLLWSGTAFVCDKLMCQISESSLFVFSTGRWRKRHLTYRLYSHSKDLGVAATRKAIQTAFKYWSDVTRLTFQEVRTGRADIRLSFHGSSFLSCSRPFDGPGTDTKCCCGGVVAAWGLVKGCVGCAP